jgi:tetratricopeptide (TPR) repeat protein
MNGEEFLGVIVEQGSESFKLRQGTKVWELVRARVREIVPVQVDALDVLDPEELYAQELARRSPSTALEFYNLAVFCESLQLWARAKQNLEEVQKLDPQFKSDIVRGKIRRAELRMESSEDSALLAKAQRLAQRDLYDQALAILDEFLSRKPGSPLRAEFEKARRALAGQRDKWIRGQVIFHFFIQIERIARSIAADPHVSSKEARKTMETEGTTRALETAANALKVKVEEVRAVWEDPKRQTASMHYAGYGSGTWTLGDMDAVLKGLVKEDPDEAAANAAQSDSGSGDESLEDKVRKLLDQKKKAQEEAQKRSKSGGKQPQAKGPEIADIPPTEDEWWASVGTDERTEYLLAWWADHDPHVKVKPDARACSACAGKGILKYFDRSGDDKWVPCPRCKGAQIDRILRYH